jgi:hypothetical protein
MGKNENPNKNPGNPNIKNLKIKIPDCRPKILKI